jgi:hypothetical protein
MCDCVWRLSVPCGGCGGLVVAVVPGSGNPRCNAVHCSIAPVLLRVAVFARVSEGQGPAVCSPLSLWGRLACLVALWLAAFVVCATGLLAGCPMQGTGSVWCSVAWCVPLAAVVGLLWC